MHGKPYDWSVIKNEKLKAERDISFEEMITAIEDGGLLDTVDTPHPQKYGGQRMFVVDFCAYVYLVPFVEDDEKIFLKTIFPSRKATKKFLKSNL